MGRGDIRTVWVSGSQGRLGRQVCALLRSEGFAILEADRRGPSPVDLTDPVAVARSMVGADAIIHLAAIASPEDIEPAELVHCNTMAGFNALEQSWLAGIRVAVVASSGAICGTAFSPAPLHYNEIPVTEQTALEYVDPYALTKDLLERMGQMYARRGMTVSALRFHWILTLAEVRELARQREEERYVHNLWGYVDIDDAARACLYALFPRVAHRGYEALLIAGNQTHSYVPTSQLLDQYLPGTRRNQRFLGHAGAFDTGCAAETIGWQPEVDWRAVPDRDTTP